MIDEARTRHPGYLFECGRLEELDFPAEQFTVVLGAWGPLMHVERLAPFAFAVRTALKPGGHFLLMSSAYPGHKIAALADLGIEHETVYHHEAQLEETFGGVATRIGLFNAVYGRR